MPTVLIIDDDAAVRSVCRQSLELDGFRVREAADGQEGLTAFLVEPADVVLCDLFMPERDGLGTINELRRVRPGARIIAMSGGWQALPAEEMLAIAGALGAVSVVTKPFTRVELLTAVRGALATR